MRLCGELFPTRSFVRTFSHTYSIGYNFYIHHRIHTVKIYQTGNVTNPRFSIIKFLHVHVIWIYVGRGDRGCRLAPVFSFHIIRH